MRAHARSCARTHAHRSARSGGVVRDAVLFACALLRVACETARGERRCAEIVLTRHTNVHAKLCIHAEIVSSHLAQTCMRDGAETAAAL
eukprot:934500-Pleurochrysis_carterae.AAC.1